MVRCLEFLEGSEWVMMPSFAFWKNSGAGGRYGLRMGAKTREPPESQSGAKAKEPLESQGGS